MAVEKRLAFSIVQFLRDQTHCVALNSDEQESLEVAIQCLETTFKINSSDCHLAAPQPLTEIFLNSLLKNDQNNLVLPETSPSPEDTERAEQLKNEGNNHMKEENYSCAVECYTKAIDLDLRNAVYYCNSASGCVAGCCCYHHRRAAAHSKLGNYTEATGDCERAIGIDPSYSKAYGRMGLALTAMNKYPEAISYFKKALVLDPENDTYKSNLKIAEQKQKEASSPMAMGLGFDMASLINNPAFISMAASVMQNQQVQQLMSGMMSNAVGGPAAGVGGLSDISSLIEAGQQFAQQIQQQNPELIEQLRNHIRSRSFSGSAEEHS
ncbi:small glutamine-rich tetratricopeptide repeat-containing protein beta-like isoform 1-T2 [Salvelinus alpinus]|uniref:small glutamine-rich tetratricopeptide repeat-containing protein beta isoform X1 n=1 Tax=Salvelinus fontinalis TaxID=8038 RepID=UPI0024862A55|nr:small glutamine-rich tetratricopeptide repeat-containing protein beta isoform X1 [Salvelinus fontinalis]XP_055730100.1 small glutamine-rich tetratricopeptide repeat-containing protein beta isoform X1 [Salvelinus fontinalis]